MTEQVNGTSTIVLSSETVCQLCIAHADAATKIYHARMQKIKEEPQKRADYIKEKGWGPISIWWWMSSESDFRNRLYRSREWARAQYARDCELANKIYAAASCLEATGKMVTMTVNDHHSLVTLPRLHEGELAYDATEYGPGND